MIPDEPDTIAARCPRCGQVYWIDSDGLMYHAVLGCVSEIEEHLLMASWKRGSRRGAAA